MPGKFFRYLNMIKAFFSVTIIWFWVSTSFSQAIDTKTLVDKMLQAIEATPYFECDFHSEERFADRYHKNQLQLKVSVSPKKFYLKAVSPNKGAEILYNPNLFKNKVYINPNMFLVPNVKLKPTHSILLDNQHHTLSNIGFDFFKDVVKNALLRAGDQFSEVFTFTETINWNDKHCYVLIINDSTAGIEQYTVQEDETIFDLCYKLKISEYSIIELNENVKGFWDVKPGMTITVPTSYSPKATIYIDAENFLPVFQLMEDEKGLFEQYEFRNLKVREGFAHNEFEPEFEAYEF